MGAESDEASVSDAAAGTDAAAAGEADDGTDGRTADRGTMADVSHRNPYTGDTLGAVFRRGPAVADGGVADGSGPDREAGPAGTGEEATMDEIDHTPRNDDVNAVWTRGGRTDGAGAGADVSGVPGDD